MANDVHPREHWEKRTPPDRRHDPLHIHRVSNMRRPLGHPARTIENGVDHFVHGVVLFILSAGVEIRFEFV